MKKVGIAMMCLVLYACTSTPDETVEQRSEAQLQYDFTRAKIDFDLYINPVLTPGKNAPEEWEVSEQFRGLLNETSESIYKDSAQIYLDSLKAFKR